MEPGPTRAERKAATATRILEAAKLEFGAHGEDGATVRSIARRAGVDPSLVLQHYGSKQKLFALAVRPAEEMGAGDVPAHLEDVLKIRLRELSPATRALMRSMLTSPEAAEVMREYLQERVTNLSRALSGEAAELRASVIVSSILGLTIARHFVDLPALQNVDDETLDAVIDSWFAPLDHD